MADLKFNEKLVAVQSKLKAPKSQYNSFGKYNYRNAEDILEAVKPLLAANGLMMTINDDIVQIGDRFYVKATVTVSDGTSYHAVSAFAREDETKKGMDGSQVTGASSSYARKYALNGMFLIDDTKDADYDGTQEAAKKSSPKPVAEKKPAENKKEEKEEKAAKIPLKEGTRAFDGAVAWIAAQDLMILDAIDKIRPKYEIDEATEKALALNVERIRTQNKVNEQK